MKEIILSLRAEGLTYRKIASDLGITVGAVAGCLHREKFPKTVVFKPEKSAKPSIAPYIQPAPTKHHLYAELRKAVENTK